MTIKLETIEKQLKNAASKVVSAEEAAYFADLVLETHLRKAPRMNPLEDAVSEMCAEIRRQKPAEGHEQVAIPGDRGHQKTAAARKAGKIEVKDQVAEELMKLAS